MNFLTHYVLNRRIRGLDGGAYFAMGLALPDLWPRFSRRRRIRWRHVEQAEPSERESRALRDGMLNHAADDRRFHTLPLFLGWQRRVRQATAPAGGDAVTDFLGHIALELALDYRLLIADRSVADAFYAELSVCAVARVERDGGFLAGVDSSGLGAVITSFLQRRFLARYLAPDGMVEAIIRVFGLTSVPAAPDRAVIRMAVRAAVETAEPDALWPAMNPA